MFQSRTHNCAALRAENAGEKVVLCGWFENLRRVSKNLGFAVLRDFYGVTQLVIENTEMMGILESLNSESVIRAEGTVRERSSKNPSLPTGDIEVVPEKIEVLGKCIYPELPFEINRSKEADENTRLKFRFLDLRNPAVKERMVLRSRVISDLRHAMEEEGFMEITTPILTSSSPEGARDYLVPSRLHPGEFYALPQAPQQFKQILMASGIDRYFQIAPCFRDEDARADRSPGEFYQLDMELSFASQEDVFEVVERVLPPVFARYGVYKSASEAPFRRIKYLDALEMYGTDKPDLRIDLTVDDVTAVLSDCGFTPFASPNVIKAVKVSAFDASRKTIDRLMAETEVISGNKACWFKVAEDMSFTGGISKFLSERHDALAERLELKAGDFVAMAAGEILSARKTAGVLVKLLGREAPGHFKEDVYEFCWIVDFPMYEIGEESGELEFCHNPFSMPQGGLEALKNTDPLKILAYQYDLVCNGVELSSGAVRNHDPEIMVAAFEKVGLGEEDVRAKFPAMYNAFCYGAPPHAGIAPGVDRMIMLIAGESSIREIIPFPMNKNAEDLLMGAPGRVEEKQLKDVHISVELPDEDVKAARAGE